MLSPPNEWPTSTYGPGTFAALSNSWRSVTAAATFRGIGTGSLRPKSFGADPITVPGRSYVHTRVNCCTPASTGVAFGSSETFQESPRPKSPESSTTVGSSAAVTLEIQMTTTPDRDATRERCGTERASHYKHRRDRACEHRAASHP